jgi:hypothetical protein
MLGLRLPKRVSSVSAGRTARSVASLLEQLPRKATEGGVIVDDQHRRGHVRIVAQRPRG